MRAIAARWHVWLPLTLVCLALLPGAALAHDISAANAAVVKQIDGPAPILFLYLGAKHMVTGLDLVLFLAGVVFFLYRLRDVVLYVSMFTIGHSLTLMGGVLLGTGVNASLVDAIIGLSVVYKGFENIGGLRKLGIAIDTRAAVFAFGLAHGLGLATKLMALTVSPNGLLTNLVSFNVGVEIGQVLVLIVLVALLNFWRRRPSFNAGAFSANVALIAAGLILTGYHLTGYVTT
jgi:hypothetical protein